MVMSMIKFFVVLCCIFFFAFPVSAETVQLYASVDDSNSTVNLLGDVMRNDPAYDPYNQYAILRAGERDYRVYFGRDISKSSICYTYTLRLMVFRRLLIVVLSVPALTYQNKVFGL